MKRRNKYGSEILAGKRGGGVEPPTNLDVPSVTMNIVTVFEEEPSASLYILRVGTTLLLL